MKNLGIGLQKLGFRALGARMYACRAGDLVHAVVATKDRYGSSIISVLVCTPSFLKEGDELSLDNLQSPLSADISPRGAIESWAWEKGALHVDFILETIAGFFKAFATAADVRHALDSVYISPYFSVLLPLDSPAPQSVLALPDACYPVPGGASSLRELSDQFRQHLIAALAPLGFVLADTSDVIAIRHRGDMADAVRVVLDAFGTYVTLVCFPWPAAIARVDKRWKGRFYPMLRYDVQRKGRPCLLSGSEFGEMDHEQLRSLLHDSLGRSADIRSHLDFAAQLGSEWTEMAAKLRRIPA